MDVITKTANDQLRPQKMPRKFNVEAAAETFLGIKEHRSYSVFRVAGERVGDWTEVCRVPSLMTAL